MSKVYSYVRFSSAEQIKGHSLQRQLEASKKYCEQNGLILDEDLTLHDLGVSAYKGMNASNGKLGAFIQAVDEGKVQRNSTLLVESLDRLSRTEVLSSLSLFTSILDKGITIVTLSDNKVYTRENINDIGNLLFSLIIMSRAHEESAMKSVRIKAAWDSKQLKAKTSKTPLTKICPAWLELIDGKFKIKAGCEEPIRLVFDMYLKGYGYKLITKELIQRFKPFEGHAKMTGCWHESYVVRLLTNKYVTGEFKEIKDYFPRIISDDDWFKAQQLRSTKKGSGGKKSAIINLFSHISKCGYCGGSMVRATTTGKKNYASMVCKHGSMGISDCGWGGWNMDELEDAILIAISELDIDQIIGSNDNREILNKVSSSIDALEFKIKQDIERREKLTDALELGGDVPIIVNRLKKYYDDELADKQKLEELKTIYQLELNQYNKLKDAQTTIKELKNKLTDPNIRMVVNTEIKKIVKKILLFNKIKKFVLEYHNTTTKVQFKSGEVVIFPENDEQFEV